MTSFLKPCRGRFYAGDCDLGSVIFGKVSIADKRFLAWGNNGQVVEQHPCLNEQDCPAGFVVAYDLDILANGAIYRLTLCHKALEVAFMPYLRTLSDDGLQPEDVFTRIEIMDRGNFNAFTFIRV